MKKHISIISAILAIIIIVIKLPLDMDAYRILTEEIPEGFPPTVIFSGLYKIVFKYFMPFALLSFLLSIIGWRKRSKFYKIALVLNILSLLYLIFPMSLILVKII